MLSRDEYFEIFNADATPSRLTAFVKMMTALEEARTVIEWYGDEETYERKLISKSSFEQYEPSTYTKMPVLVDGGTKARELLKSWGRE